MNSDDNIGTQAEENIGIGFEPGLNMASDTGNATIGVNAGVGSTNGSLSCITLISYFTK